MSQQGFNNAMVAGCGGDVPYVDWPGGCPYWPGFYGYWPGYGYGGAPMQGQAQADAQAQRVVNNIYVIRKEVPMNAAVGACGGGAPMMYGAGVYGVPPAAAVGACGGGMPMYGGPRIYGTVGQTYAAPVPVPPAGMPGSEGFDITVNIAPGYQLKIDPYRGNGSVVLAMTLETPYGPVEAIGRMSEATFQTMVREGRARIAPRLQRWLMRQMQRLNGNAMALPPSVVPATPGTPAVDVLDIDMSRMDGSGGSVGQWYGDDAWLDAVDSPVTEEVTPSYDWPTYPVYAFRRPRRRRRPWWLRRYWSWWYPQGWYNPYYPGNYPYGPYWLNGRWVFGPPQLQGSTYTVNGQPVNQAGQPTGGAGGSVQGYGAGVGQRAGFSPRKV